MSSREQGERISDRSSISRSQQAAVNPSMSTALPKMATARWLRILQEVTEGAIAHLDLQSLLHEMLGRVREAMQVDNTAILLTSADGAYLTVYVAHGPEEEVTGQAQVRFGYGVAGTIAARRQAIIVDDLSQVDVENPLLRATARSLVGAPLIAGERVLGVIHVDSTRRGYFTEDDRQLLQVIASRVALAIEHTQLYEAERTARQETEAANQQLKALQAISDVALETAELDDLLRALLMRIQEMMEVDNVAILLPTADHQELTLFTVRGAEEAVMGMVHVPMGQGVAGTIAATRTPLIVDNLASVPVANPFLKEHFTSLLGVPLLEAGELIGVIHVDSVGSRHFTEQERLLLQALAERIAPAIARAQQFESEHQSRAEAERRVAILQATTDRMDAFISVASHELRTPLTSLTMNVQLLNHWLVDAKSWHADAPEAPYAARMAAKVSPLIQRSHQSIKRLDRLVGDLIDASRIYERGLDLRLRRTDLVALVRETLEHHRLFYPERTLRLRVRAAEPMFVDVDADRVGQVLANYLSNAAKYSNPQRPVTVVVAVKRNRGYVSVRDEGVGIPQAELANIWERFYRVEAIKHQTGSRVGLGLGLYISRDIIERHDGQVGVRSAIGKGSTFWFTLPLATPEDGSGSDSATE
jgi:signal transduction histidine kinase